ncbi:response regulator, partial [Candidatus Aerophobetes bacterium]|nr:response regulator [Candidatus Aerophobetes bacterium]
MKNKSVPIFLQEDLRILLLEDVQSDAELVERELHTLPQKYTLCRVDTEEAFVKELEDFKPHIILLDYHLPTFNGLSALKIAREKYPDVPVIFVSGAIGEDIAVETLKQGATDYVLKGRLFRLVPAVKRALAEAEERKKRKLAEEALKQRTYDLDERVKELHCLYGISRLMLREDNELADILSGAVNIIAASWQYPQITCVRVSLGEKKFTTDNFKETIWKQASTIVVDGVPVGAVEVFYLEAMPESDEGPFLKEERDLINAVAERLGEIVKVKRAEKRITQLNSILLVIRGVHQLIIREKNRDDLLRKICDTMIEARGLECVWIALFDEKKRFTGGRGVGFDEIFSSWQKQLQERRLPECIKKVLDREEIFVTENPALTCAGCPIAEKYVGRRAVVLRLQYGEKIFGAFGLSLLQEMILNEEERLLLKGVADDIAFSLHNLELEEKLKQSLQNLEKLFDGIVKTVSLICEKRDPYTSGHEERVTKLACAIAREMSLSFAQIEGIRVASFIHDIGKITVPAEILSKPGKLTEIELAMIKPHPSVAYDILKEIDFPWPVAEAILQHHERLDGSGYPQGILDEKIL